MVLSTVVSCLEPRFHKQLDNICMLMHICEGMQMVHLNYIAFNALDGQFPSLHWNSQLLLSALLFLSG